MVNIQDGDSPVDALPHSATMPKQQDTYFTTIRDIREDISNLTAGLQKLEQEIKEMRAHQKNLDSVIATKNAAHMEPLRKEMNRTFLDQQRKFGTDLEELKQYCTVEQDKRDLARG